jgi:non-ribosomal peptide synthetase component F
VFGVTKTTRRGTISDADAIVGLFLATIPVRVEVDPEATILEWLRRVREEWVSLRGREHVPLVDIKQASALPASASLFDSFLMFENYELVSDSGRRAVPGRADPSRCSSNRGIR